MFCDFRIKYAYDEFEINLMVGNSHTEANVTNVQGVTDPEPIHLGNNHPTPKGSFTQTNQTIELDNESDDETIRIKLVHPMNSMELQLTTHMINRIMSHK